MTLVSFASTRAGLVEHEFIHFTTAVVKAELRRLQEKVGDEPYAAES